MCLVKRNSEWTERKLEFKNRRAAFANRQRRRGGMPVQYPPELSTPFPKFDSWLNCHVRLLKEEGFPISHELDSLHCPPSEHAFSFGSMWAFGCHYSCNSETVPSTVSYDCGIAAIPPSETCTEIDVGILKRILLIYYLDLSCVVMEASWIKTRDQGRRVVKKDSYGFWTVHFSSRERSEKDNPYVYPSTVSQVFFVGDTADPAWKVVLRHDPRSKRVIGDREVHVFGAPGSSRPMLSTVSMSRQDPESSQSTAEGEEVPVEQINAFLHGEERPDDDHHLDDTQFEDPMELQYVD